MRSSNDTKDHAQKTVFLVPDENYKDMIFTYLVSNKCVKTIMRILKPKPKPNTCPLSAPAWSSVRETQGNIIACLLLKHV